MTMSTKSHQTWKKEGDFSFDYRDFSMQMDPESREASQRMQVEYIHWSGQKIGFYSNAVAGGATGRSDDLTMTFTTQKDEILNILKDVVWQYDVFDDFEGNVSEPVVKRIKIKYAESRSSASSKIINYSVIVIMLYPVNSELIYNFLNKIFSILPAENGLIDDIFSTIRIEKPNMDKSDQSDSKQTEMEPVTDKPKSSSDLAGRLSCPPPLNVQDAKSASSLLQYGLTKKLAEESPVDEKKAVFLRISDKLHALDFFKAPQSGIICFYRNNTLRVFFPGGHNASRPGGFTTALDRELIFEPELRKIGLDVNSGSVQCMGGNINVKMTPNEFEKLLDSKLSEKERQTTSLVR